MASHRILDLTDSALVAYLIAQGAGDAADVLPGKAVGDKALPNTVCDSSSWSAPSGMEFTGNAEVQASITVNSAAFDADGNDMAAASAARVAATFDPFYEPDPSTLGAAITAATSGMTVIAARVTGGDRSFADGAWHDSISLELLCCPSALT